MKRVLRLVAVPAAGVGLAIVLYAAVTMIGAYVGGPGVVRRYVATHEMRLTRNSLPAGYLEILLSVEDPRFLTHHGIDLSTPGAGYTTITQGLVKILYFKSFKPGLAKLRQSLIAPAFDRRVDKDTQLALFLNSVYMGTTADGTEVHGLGDAARVYFGKDFPALSRDEFMALVAMIVAPNAYSVARQPSENAERVRRIKKLLAGECRPLGLTDVYYKGCK